MKLNKFMFGFLMGCSLWAITDFVILYDYTEKGANWLLCVVPVLLVIWRKWSISCSNTTKNKTVNYVLNRTKNSVSFEKNKNGNSTVISFTNNNNNIKKK